MRLSKNGGAEPPLRSWNRSVWKRPTPQHPAGAIHRPTPGAGSNVTGHTGSCQEILSTAPDVPRGTRSDCGGQGVPSGTTDINNPIISNTYTTRVGQVSVAA